MTPLAIALSAAAAVCAAATAWLSTTGPMRPVWIVKPAATLSIIALAALRPGGGSPAAYKTFLIAGLVFSLAGDVFLVDPEKLFKPGLTSFLVAQLLYTRAFLFVTPARVDFWTVLPLLVFSLFMMAVLFPHVGRLKAPIAVYILVITIMAGLAANRYVEAGGALALRAFAGAILFVISDAILAVNKFARKIPGGRALNLATYFVAQWLLAMSI